MMYIHVYKLNVFDIQTNLTYSQCLNSSFHKCGAIFSKVGQGMYFQGTHCPVANLHDFCQ